MCERGISAAQVEAVLAKPERCIPDPLKNSVRLERDFDDRTLKVWVVGPWPATREIVVKSTAWKYSAQFTVLSTAVGKVIGTRGTTIQGIRDRNGAHIVVKPDGTVRISAGELSSLATARQQILAIAGRPPVSDNEQPRRR